MSDSSHRLSYRADIDGLRAVAVIAVVFFHAGLGFGGGYAGVDIFFVISGFLITSLILKDLRKGASSIIHFWERLFLSRSIDLKHKNKSHHISVIHVHPRGRKRDARQVAASFRNQ